MSDFDGMYRKLNDAQRQAVDAIDGPLLVIAGPGTGKTQLLSARVANILRQTDVSPSSVLCLTFTEAAAGNMRERLTGMIGEAAYDVHIDTYHSFASDIIRSNPEYFETIDLQTGQDSRMERPIDDIRQLDIIRSIIDGLPYDDPLKKAQHYLKSVSGTISDLKQAALTPADVAAIASENLSACRKLSPPIHNLMAPHGSIPRKADTAISLFASINDTLVAHGSNLAQTAHTELTAALEHATEQNSTKPLTAWKNTWLTKDEDDNWTFTTPRHAERLASLAKIYATYQDTLQRGGEYDFNDMIIQTIHALQTKPELKFNLQERYQYILLDEFQDTNAAQFELVKQLADHPVHEGRPNIMAVGDDDQGIFAFQGADIGNMIAFINTFRDVQVINLTQNYRSHHDILHVAHQIAGQIESRLHHNLDNVTKTLEAAATHLPKQATIARHEFASQASEFGWIADQIDALSKQGVPLSEISVIAPRHAVLENLVPFLNAQNIPVSYEKRENIFEAPIVQNILLCAEFLQAAAVQDIQNIDMLLPRVLSLYFWKIPTKTIWQLNWAAYAQQRTDGKRWAELALEDTATQDAAEFLLALGQQADRLPLEHMLDYLTGATPLTLDGDRSYTSPLKAYYFSAQARQNSPLLFYEAISHLSVIRSVLREQQTTADNQLTIKHLLDLRRTYAEAEQPLINTHPSAQAAEAIQLQTVYKAKGLEYDYVFLPCMLDDIWGSKASGSSNKLSLPPNLQHIRHGVTNEDTKRRLLFVAITRAKHGLFTTSHALKETGKATTPAKYYQERAEESGRVSDVLPTGSNQVIMTERAPAQVSQDVDTMWHARHLALQPDLRSLLAHKLQNYRMSPTHLNNFTNVQYHGPEDFLINTLLRFPQAQSNESIYGDALHKTLEWYQKQGKDNTWPTTDAATKYFASRIAKTRLPEEQKSTFIQQGTAALTTYLGHNATRLQQPGFAEVDFYKEGVTYQGAVLTGKIDRLEVDAANKTVRIIDFKSGTPSTKWSSQTKYLGYKQQLYFYHLLIERSHTYKGYKVASAALEFLQPLENGQVAPPLELPFDPQEYEEFKQLVVAVWNRIQNLDLPDTSTYAQTAPGMRKFAQDLIS